MLLIQAGVVVGQGEERGRNYRVVAIKPTDNEHLKSVSNETTLYFPLNLYIPNAFTPNGDGINDFFGAVGEGIDSYRLRIFNRWGVLVFETTNLNHQWDGYYNGQLAPIGAYTYEVFARGHELGQVSRSGSVVLVN